ncbi:putative reverse transcriptase domain-containing protein [Tanacetum coccineum]
MSTSAVLVPYSSGESVGSSTSLIILSDSETVMIVILAVVPTIILEIASKAEAAAIALPAGVLDLAIHHDSEFEPYEALPSLVYHAIADLESDPFEAESEEDPLEDDPSEATKPQPTQAISSLPVQIASILPVELIPITCVIPRGTRITARMTVHPQPPLPSCYEATIARWRATILSTEYLESSSAEPLSHSSGSLPSSSFETSPVSSHSSSRTSHTSSGPLPPPAVLSHMAVDHLQPRKMFRGTPVASTEDDTITIEERLEEYEETLQGMYEHLLEISLLMIDGIKEDGQTLRDTLIASKGVSTNLRERVRSLELSELSLRDSLRTIRAERAEITMHVTCRGLTAAAIERLVNQHVTDAPAAQEANWNNENGGGNGNRNKARNRNEVNRGVGGVVSVARACTYKDFLNCQPRNFSGTEGVVVRRRDILALPNRNKCKLHHDGLCTMRCNNCKKVGHLARDCKATTNATNQRAPGITQNTVTFFECGRQGHFKKVCRKLRNQNRGNQAAICEAHGRAYTLGGGEAN